MRLHTGPTRDTIQVGGGVVMGIFRCGIFHASKKKFVRNFAHHFQVTMQNNLVLNIGKLVVVPLLLPRT